MAHEIPSSKNFTGHSRTVIEYSERFGEFVKHIKDGTKAQSLWEAFEALVDVKNFVRQGVFLTDKCELIDWPTYQFYVSKYSGDSHWEATLRHITEKENRVILELEERSTSGDKTQTANTVTTYEFNDEGKLRRLEVYVMHLD